MPEPNVLYSVTAAVVVGLVAWVAVVLKNAKEPWTRDVPPPPAVEPAADAPLVKDEPTEAVDSKKPASAPPSSSLPKVEAGEASGPPDATAPATAVILKKKTEEAEAKGDGEAKADADENADAEAKADENADAEAKTDAKKEA